VPNVGVIQRIARVLTEHRHQSYVAHSLIDLLKQGVFRIASVYGDTNDCDDSRRGIIFKAEVTLLGENSQFFVTNPESSLAFSDLKRGRW
jgi:hypothetical protein